IAGVMGGAETEVVDATTELLIESAEFAPLSIRNTARRLNLHSDSSYRFERSLDPEGVEWASRRACELILELAGGELAAGAIDVGRQPAAREPVVLRLAQLKRILGIEIDAARVRQILTALGNVEVESGPDRIEVVPPAWRRDLTREIDLVEEVARIHGYDEIPEDVGVPMVASSRSDEDRVLAKARHVLTAAGLDEAISVSVVEESASDAFSPWSTAAPLQCLMPILRRADRLRRSLVPSLLGVRRTNEALANPRIELFEIARVYLPREAELPTEELMLAIASGGDYFAVKGIVESLVESLAPGTDLEVVDTQAELLDAVRSCELRIAGQVFGYLGEVSAAGLKRFELRAPATVAEVKLGVLAGIAKLIPPYVELPPYPSVARDLNLVVDETVRWADLARTVAATGSESLESLRYKDTYRDPERLGPGKKSLLFSMDFRARKSTLTNEEVDAIRDRIVGACQAKHGAQLRA
ncbi:MAG: phenylalanine--tRNA ligase subunit beta, partial [Pirellulales bacterium]